MNPPAPGRRVAVTSPRTIAARRTTRTSVRREVGEQTALGEVMLRSLQRAQLRLAALVGVTVSAVLLGIPTVFLTWPAARHAEIAGIPLAWPTLGLVAFPVIVGSGWVYLRAAERNERRFAALVQRPEDGHR